MATQNFFALLGEDENDDPSFLIARASAPPKPKAPEKPALVGVKKQPQPQPAPARLPTKPPPPAQAVKEAQTALSERGRGRGGRGGRGGGRGTYNNRDQDGEGHTGRQGRDGGYQGDRGNYNDRNFSNNRERDDPQGERGGYGGGRGVLSYGVYGDAPSPAEDAEGGRQGDGGRGRGRGGRGRGRGYGYGDGEEQPRRRDYDRRSGTGRGNEMKRDGAGRANWGIDADENAAQETVEPVLVEEHKTVPEVVEKKPEGEAVPDHVNVEEKKEEEEDNEMTLDEYEKVLVEKRKALEALKSQERKVTLDKDFESMQLVDKKQDDITSMKLGIEKEKGKKKETAEKEEKARKSVSINEFLKPADGEEYYSPTGRRGRGRGRSDRGGYRGGFGGGYSNAGLFSAPRIEDPGQFPTLGGK